MAVADPDHPDGQPPKANPARVHARIRDLLRRLTLESHRHTALVARDMGLSTTDVHAVGVLQACDGGLSAGQLGDALALSPPATSALLGRLERADHAVRGNAAHDGRRAHIAPTATAVGESRERFTALNAAIDAVLERHDPAEIESVHTVLAELLDAVRAANDSHRALARDGSAVRT